MNTLPSDFGIDFGVLMSKNCHSRHTVEMRSSIVHSVHVQVTNLFWTGSGRVPNTQEYTVSEGDK